MIYFYVLFLRLENKKMDHRLNHIKRLFDNTIDKIDLSFNKYGK
jgi:hypothetical protein